MGMMALGNEMVGEHSKESTYSSLGKSLVSILLLLSFLKITDKGKLGIMMRKEQ